MKINVKNDQDPIHQWNFQEIQEYVAYDKWKEIIVGIQADRVQRCKKDNDPTNEFDDPELNQALRQVPSSELLAQPTGTSSLQRASQPSNEQLSYSEQQEARARTESGGQ